MQTDTLCAFQVENNDFVVVDNEVVGYVYSKDEEGDFIHLDVVDEEGEHTILPYGPFDTVSIVTKFDDDEDWEKVLEDPED